MQTYQTCFIELDITDHKEVMRRVENVTENLTLPQMTDVSIIKPQPTSKDKTFYPQLDLTKEIRSICLIADTCSNVTGNQSDLRDQNNASCKKSTENLNATRLADTSLDCTHHTGKDTDSSHQTETCPDSLNETAAHSDSPCFICDGEIEQTAPVTVGE